MLGNLRLFWAKTNRWHRIIFLFLILRLKLVPPGQLGFICNDPDLSHSFTGDTISWKWLFAVTLSTPLLVMLLTERAFHKQLSTKNQATHWYKEYLFGLMINLLIVETTKVIVAAPRPHFFDTCQPEESITCKGSDYVPSYTCTKAHWLTQSDRSFPSGHTSMAVHAAIFTIWYLHRRITNHHHNLFAPVTALQSLFLAGAVFCSVSRMTDHRHHFKDVIGGAIVAVFVLVFTIIVLCRNFVVFIPKDQTKPTEQTKSQEAAVTL